MNRLSPKKLKNSKWTSLNVSMRQKHFIVSKVEYDDEGNVILCEIEAVIDKQTYHIDWCDLKDNTHWKMGWH